MLPLIDRHTLFIDLLPVLSLPKYTFYCSDTTRYIIPACRQAGSH